MGHNVGHAVVGSHPHGVVGVLGRRDDIGTVQARLHVEQRTLVALEVVDSDTGWRTEPDESAAVHHGMAGSRRDGVHVTALRQRAVEDFEIAGIDQCEVL